MHEYHPDELVSAPKDKYALCDVEERGPAGDADAPTEPLGSSDNVAPAGATPKTNRASRGSGLTWI